MNIVSVEPVVFHEGTVPDPESTPLSIPLSAPTDPAINTDYPDATPEAPYGYRIDPATGERVARKRRPYKRRGSASGSGDDAAPSRPRRRRDTAPKSESEFPAFRAGPIARGMNRLYYKVGSILSAWDPMVGQACMAAATKNHEEDITVGEAWEEIARTNPKVRVVLLRLLAGNAWMNLVMCHVPIMLAVAARSGVLNRLPLGNILAAFVSSPPDRTQNVDQMFADVTPEDAAMVAGIAQGMMTNIMTSAMAGNSSMPRTPTAGAFGFPTQLPPDFLPSDLPEEN